MTILQRVLVAFGLILGICALQGASTIVGIDALSDSLTATSALPIAEMDAAWRVSDAFHEADAFLSRSLDGIHDQTRAEALAHFHALTDPIEAELRRGLSDPKSARVAGGLIDDVAGWETGALVLLGGEGASLSIPTPHAMERGGAGRSAPVCRR